MGHERFHLDTLADLRREVDRLGIELPIAEDLGVLSETVRIGSLLAWNRFAVHPMEGFDSTGDGAPGCLTRRRYRRFAAGGAALIWFEATAVLPDARSNPRQLWLHEGNVSAFRDTVRETKRAGVAATGHEPIAVLQLTHSGRYSRPYGFPQPIIANHSPVLDPLQNLPPEYPLVTDDYLDRLQDTYVHAASLAREAGFDGVDIKACHGYLVAELLAAYGRDGRYGGSFENRTRLLQEIMGRVMAEVDGVFVTTRLGVYDGYGDRCGWGVSADGSAEPDPEEPLRLLRILSELGMPVVSITMGNPYFNPHLGRPYDRPVAGVPLPGEHPLKGVHRLLQVTRRLQRALPHLPCVGTGYTWLRHLLPHVAAGTVQRGWVSLVGQGRGALAYPDSVMDILRRGSMDPQKCCITCSACSQIMREGTRVGCVVHDAEVYRPDCRRGPRSDSCATPR